MSGLRRFLHRLAARVRPDRAEAETFVPTLLGARNPIGLHVRQPQNGENLKAGPWYQIVGVVRDLSVVGDKISEDAILYRPAPPVGALRALVRAKRDAAA